MTQRPDALAAPSDTLAAPSFRPGCLGGFAVLALLAGAADAGLLWMLMAGLLSAAGMAAAHAGLALASAVLAVMILRDRTPAVLLATGLAVMGPLGAAGTLILCLGDALAPRRDGQLADWYRQLSGEGPTNAAEILHDDILEDRAYRPSGLPSAFSAALAAGSVADRQGMLGRLVKQERPVPEALLTAALRSRDVAVRASAAAAVSRIREKAALRQDASEDAA